jgi:flagellar hook-basal body complex protein FliE
MAIETIKLAPTISSVGKGAASSGAAGAAGSTGFADKLQALVSNVEESSAEANQAVTNMVNKTGDVHDAMIALQRAEMTLQMTVQIRNKFVQAYQEIMRIPI